MDERKLARVFGWVSLGLGLTLLTAPAQTVRLIGMGERPGLGYLLGARDLVLAAGLLRSESPARWLRARAISDAGDAMLLTGGAASGAFPRRRAALGGVVAASFAASGFTLARRLK